MRNYSHALALQFYFSKYFTFQAYYVSEEGLGGIMFWTIDNDDFRSACSLRPFPLIESAKEALFGKEASFKT